MRIQIGQTVTVGGHSGVVVARVRADDDPRKCVPPGYRLRRRGDIPERERDTWLIDIGARTLLWSDTLAVETTPTAEQAATISDGTMASLTGYTEQRDLQRARQQFLIFIAAAAANGIHHTNWIAAWRWFVNGPEGDAMPAYDGAHGLFVFETKAHPGDQGSIAAPTGRSWVCLAERPMTVTELKASDRLGRPQHGDLIRVGFVAKHWLVGAAQDRFLAWAKAQ